MKYIKKCQCGSTQFLLNEGSSYEAELLKDGVLEVTKNYASEIESVVCKKCGRQHSSLKFKKIDFVW